MIRKHFSEELEKLRERVVYMGGIVEEAIARSVNAVSRRDAQMADSVIAELEPEVNRLEVDIDEEALRMLALQQPLAIDLRFLAAVLKINSNLERMGDLAVNIAQSVPRLREALPDVVVDLPHMAERARWMTRCALDSLMSRNANLAQQVLEADDEVDHMRDEVFRALFSYISDHPRYVEPAIAQIFVARNLERIADHATNIAEEVIFWLQGVDVRHHLQDQHA
jgi:phosphate transport system protein